jgi:hypothetical protein
LYGREVYTTLRNARQNYLQEDFDIAPVRKSFLNNSIFVSYLIVSKATTDLSDPDQALFIPAVETFGASVIDVVNKGVISGGEIKDTGGLTISYPDTTIYDPISGDPRSVVGSAAILADNSANFIYWKQSTGAVTIDAIGPSPIDVFLGTAGTAVGDIVEVHSNVLMTKRLSQRLEIVAEQEPARVSFGMKIEPDPDPGSLLDVLMTSGRYVIDGLLKHPVPQVNSRTEISPGVYSMTRYFHSLGVPAKDTAPTIDVLNYDNGTNLTVIPNNNWVVAIFAYEHDEENDISKISYFYPDRFFPNETGAQLFAYAIQSGAEAIPNKPPGFFNNPMLMAYVFKQNDAVLAAVGDARWVDLTLRTGSGGGGGDSFIPASFVQTYFVRENGNNGLSGTNWQDAFADFVKAISEVVLQTPTSANQYAIKCDDSGQYTGNLDVPAYCHIDAPNAIYTGEITLGSHSSVRFKNHIHNTLGEAVKGATSGIDTAYYTVDLLTIEDGASAFNGLVAVAGATVPIVCQVGKILNENANLATSFSILNLNAADDMLIVHAKEIINTSVFSVSAYSNAAGRMTIVTDKIKAADNVSYGVACDAGDIVLECGNFTGLLEVSGSGSILGKISGKFDGTLSQFSTGIINMSINDLKGINNITDVNPELIDLNFFKELIKYSTPTITGTSNPFPRSGPATRFMGIQVALKTFTPVCVGRPVTIKYLGNYGSTSPNMVASQGVWFNLDNEAVAANNTFEAVATGMMVLPLVYIYTPSTLDPVDIMVRYGPNIALPLYFNSPNGGALHNGKLESTLEITQSGTVTLD